MSVILKKINESFISISGYDSKLLKKLKDAFTFKVPNYMFNPKYKAKIWDGTITLFNLTTNQLPIGLFPELYKIVKGYTSDIIVDFNLFDKGIDISDEEIINFCNVIGYEHKPYEHQIYGVKKALKNKRCVLLSATSSGKSLILFMICNFLLIDQKDRKILIIVPNVQLVSQLKKDFCDYYKVGDYSKYVKMIYSGQDKDIKNYPIIISTWQSLQNIENRKEWLKQFKVVLCDEVHTSSAKVLSDIIQETINADYKIGVSGSLSGALIHEKQLNGLFGQIFDVVKAKELIDKNILAKFRVKMIILEYSKEKREELKKYIENAKKEKKKKDKQNSEELICFQSEMSFLKKQENRMNFFLEFISKLNKNSLVLFKSLDYGFKLFQELQKISNKKIFYIDGSIRVDDREKIREFVEKNDNCIIVASLGTFAQGINIRNLFNLVNLESFKSNIKLLQSIGRSLRRLENKVAYFFDISDALKDDTFINHSYKHSLERYKIYKSENHEISISKIKI